MRKIFSFLMVTMDGYDEGPAREFDFWNLDPEFDEFSVEQLDEADTLLFGRVTYEGMAEYWPTEGARADLPEVADRMNGYPKLVVSRTLERADWPDTRIVRDPAGLAELKRQPGKDVVVFGSSALTTSLVRLGLLDELRIMVNPVALGAGRSVLAGGSRGRFRLLRTRVFDSGNVLLCYQPLTAA
ncbi:dihydrofolate reductase family protein [Jiangella asiatica]|uniref:Dihydrofolate reductase n=1 Tax=Jiangella asiatica TaxID=2530372 RepID=A0A4R5DLM1_9ACTN|nr:dihydrofolate reductase family protein [Jiangella asiatica]TDE14999.1 dihydrofolate reductase [Jiangella asiatica]